MEPGRPHLRRELWDHMSTEHDLEIPKPSLILDGAHRTHAVNDEAIWFWRMLESLLAAP